jgi:hypothetical protein
MVAFVAGDEVFGTGEGGDRGSVGRIAAREDERRLDAEQPREPFERLAAKSKLTYQ